MFLRYFLKSAIFYLCVLGVLYVFSNCRSRTRALEIESSPEKGPCYYAVTLPRKFKKTVTYECHDKSLIRVEILNAGPGPFEFRFFEVDTLGREDPEYPEHMVLTKNQSFSFTYDSQLQGKYRIGFWADDVASKVEINFVGAGYDCSNVKWE